MDPLALIVYAATFIGVSLLTIRRPSFGICALILVQPFAYYMDAFGVTITLPKTALLAALLGICAYRDPFVPLIAAAPRRVLFAGLFVMLATLLTYAQAAYHDPVIRESLKALEYVLLFVVVVAAFRLDPDRRAVRNMFLFTSAAVALLALAQELAGSPSVLLINGHVTPRVAGPLEGPNQLAGYFDVALPLILAFAIEEPSLLAYATLAIVMCADILTFSRGGAIGAVAGIATVLFFYRARARKAIAPLAAGAVAGAVIAAGWALAVHSIGIFRFWSLSESNYAGGVGTRSELWHAAIVLWQRHPLFGLGAGNFELEIVRTGLHGVRTHANSLYLQALVEGGIPLFAAVVWLTLTSIATFARQQAQSAFVVAACASSVALALHQIVDFLTFYPKVGSEWWILLGLGAAELAVAVRTKAAACA